MKSNLFLQTNWLGNSKLVLGPKSIPMPSGEREPLPCLRLGNLFVYWRWQGAFSLSLMAKKRKQESTDVPTEQKKKDFSQTTKVGLGKLLLLAFVLFHFFCWIVTWNANFGQSLLYGDVLGWTANYMVPTGQHFGAAPFEWTHGEPLDFPVRVEVLEQDEIGWVPLSAANETARWPIFARYLTIVADDDRESELLSEIAFHVLRSCEDDLGPTKQIRFLRPLVPSFDEQAAIAMGQESYLGELLDGDEFFRARIIRADQEIVGLIPAQPDYRSSPLGGDDLE